MNKTIRRILSLLLTVIMSVGMISTAYSEGFFDVSESDWFYTAVTYCADRNLMTGTGDGFDPFAGVTKEQVVQTLYNMAGRPEASGVEAFADADAGAWYAPALLWAKGVGLAAGTGDNLFGVGNFVTRQELAAFFFRFAGNVAELEVSAAEDLDRFPDADAVADWAQESVRYAVITGILSGKGQDDGTALLKPLDTAMRCELASVLMRFFQMVEAQPPRESTETSEPSATVTEPTEPGPTETAEPTEPGPTETAEPTEPGPTETAEPTEPGPTETAEPTEPGPTETAEPTEPGPTETAEPTEPGPTETAEPTESTPGETESQEPLPTEETLYQVPQIRIVTEDGNGLALLKADGYVNASITITDVNGDVLEDSVQIKVRGNSTALDSIPKKAYTFKFEKKKNLLGLGKGKKWALLANTYDPTLLRNTLANTLARKLGLTYVSNRTFVELWLDDSYRGCYELYVPVEVKPERVDLDIESNDGMKDFLLEYERLRTDDDETYFTVSGLRFGIKAPEEPNEAQLQYITETMQSIVDTLKTGAREKIEAVLDVPSFAKYYLLNEYLKTLDFDSSSVFYYFKDGKLYAGPPWDYDLSTGNVNADLNSTRCKQAAVPDGLYAAGKNLYKYITDKQWFLDEVHAVFFAHEADFADIYADGGLLDRLLDAYQPVFERNFGVWPVGRMWMNHQMMPLPTYAENYQYLKDWCAQRNAWLSAEFENQPKCRSYRFSR